MLRAKRTTSDLQKNVAAANKCNGFVPRMVHTIKILAPYAYAVADGSKTFEVRLNDRGYNRGDLVRFRVIDDGIEWRNHPLTNMTFRITYVHSGLGLQESYVVFGIEKVEEGEEADEDLHKRANNRT